MPWLQLHLTATRPQTAVIEALLEGLGALSVSLNDAEDQPLLEPKPGEQPLWDHLVVTGLFDGETDPETLRADVEEVLIAASLDDLLPGVRLERLEDQVWERVWLDQFHPMRFGRRLWVCPDGQRPPADELGDGEPVVVDLDPGLAFGTGTHPTTALCLAWLDGIDLAGRTAIDFGCGSGILAVAALKLGATHAVAIDHDPQALIATRDNAAKNGVAERVEVLGSDAPPPKPAEIVLANILAGTLIELAPLISPLVLPGGWLVLSGILDHQADAVAAAYLGEFEMEPAAIQEGWARLAGRRR